MQSNEYPQIVNPCDLNGDFVFQLSHVVENGATLGTNVGTVRHARMSQVRRFCVQIPAYFDGQWCQDLHFTSSGILIFWQKRTDLCPALIKILKWHNITIPMLYSHRANL